MTPEISPNLPLDRAPKEAPSVGGDLYGGIREVLLASRLRARQAVNTAMVQAYWEIGRLIVEGEQGGKERAAYGKRVLPELAQRLTAEFGKGFSAQSLWSYRQFYLSFPILSTAWRELSWSHFRMLLRLKSPEARAWYADEAAREAWGVRALDRQIGTLFYERRLLSQEKAAVQQEARANIAAEASADPRDFIRDPYVLEFLELQPGPHLHEAEIEQGLIDLKKGKLTHQDVGQMDMYVRISDETLCSPGDNPSIGLILCSERNAAVAKYSQLASNPQLFASQYSLILPTEEELRAELERDRAWLEAAQANKED